VGAAHAGWRGLAGGVIEATVAALCEAAACEPSELAAWLGPCIGPRQFEVGADVLAAFGAGAVAPGPRFVARARADGSLRWLADLAGLASDRLAAAGVVRVRAAGCCTVEDSSRFFSFRRDGVTGRMAAAVWLR
jgi:copper oxidase (laccase) domain-containing protein